MDDSSSIARGDGGLASGQGPNAVVSGACDQEREHHGVYYPDMLENALALVSRALAATWRVRGFQEPGEPVIWAFLHGELLPLAVLHRCLPRVVAIASLSSDGERAARVLAALGYGVGLK